MVLMIDGIHFGDQVLVVALGIARFEARLHLPSVYPPRTGRLPGEGSWPTSMGCLPRGAAVPLRARAVRDAFTSYIMLRCPVERNTD